MSRIILCLSFLVLSLHYQAQNTNDGAPPFRELGLRFSGFDDFNLFYKKAVSESAVRRHRVILGLVSYNSNQKDLDVSLGYATGKEKRVPIGEDLSFIHGFEYSLSLTHSNADGGLITRSKQLFINPRIGYILGFQLDLSSKFCLSAELIPSLGGNIALFNNREDQFIIDAGINSNATALSLMYRF